jgi:hypothetical protein
MGQAVSSCDEDNLWSELSPTYLPRLSRYTWAARMNQSLSETAASLSGDVGL